LSEKGGHADAAVDRRRRPDPSEPRKNGETKEPGAAGPSPV